MREYLRYIRAEQWVKEDGFAVVKPIYWHPVIGKVQLWRVYMFPSGEVEDFGDFVEAAAWLCREGYKPYGGE